MSDPRDPKKHQRASHLRWVRLGDMRISPKAQRAFRKAHADQIAAELDENTIGYMVGNRREPKDTVVWIVDGQHRVAALKTFGFGDDDQFQVDLYEGLTEAEEAELFLRIDERKKISTFDRFRIAVVAGRDEEQDIQRIVQALGYRITQNKAEGSISAVESLRFVYKLGGPAVLRRTVALLGESFDGDPQAFTAELIKGAGMVCQRYNGELNDKAAITKLGQLSGGPMALTRKTETLALRTGNAKSHCAAAAIIDTINAGRGGNKLDSWWK